MTWDLDDYANRRNDDDDDNDYDETSLEIIASSLVV